HARAQRVAFSDHRLGVKQYCAGDERRRLLHAELEERRVWRRLHLALRQPAVISYFFRIDGTLSIPGLGAYREMAERVDLRALLAGLGVLVEGLGVERVRRAGNPRSRLGTHLVGAGERRERHGRGAELRQLVDFRRRLREEARAARPALRTELRR